MYAFSRCVSEVSRGSFHATSAPPGCALRQRMMYPIAPSMQSDRQ